MSALDADSERLVMEGLDAARRGRTVLIVAHRLATVRAADQVVVLDSGRVVDAGRHDELYSRCDLYRELCDLQMVQSSGTPAE